MSFNNGDEAREYFESLGLRYSDITEPSLSRLNRILNKHFVFQSSLNEEANKNIYWVWSLPIRKKDMKFLKGKLVSGYLFGEGSYFKRRESISFNSGGFIGFAGEADGTNRLPVFDAFQEWCNFMVKCKK